MGSRGGNKLLSVMNSIKCAGCGNAIDIMELTSHVCEAIPRPPVPSKDSKKQSTPSDPAVQQGSSTSPLKKLPLLPAPGFLRWGKPPPPPKIDPSVANDKLDPIPQLTGSDYSDYSRDASSISPRTPSTQITSPGSEWSRGGPPKQMRVPTPPSPMYGTQEPTTIIADREPLKNTQGGGFMQRMNMGASGPFGYGGFESKALPNSPMRLRPNQTQPKPAEAPKFRNAAGRDQLRKQTRSPSPMREVYRAAQEPQRPQRQEPQKNSMDRFLEEMDQAQPSPRQMGNVTPPSNVSKPLPDASNTSRKPLPNPNIPNRNGEPFQSPAQRRPVTPPRTPATDSAPYSQRNYTSELIYESPPRMTPRESPPRTMARDSPSRLQPREATRPLPPKNDYRSMDNTYQRDQPPPQIQQSSITESPPPKALPPMNGYTPRNNTYPPVRNVEMAVNSYSPVRNPQGNTYPPATTTDYSPAKPFGMPNNMPPAQDSNIPRAGGFLTVDPAVQMGIDEPEPSHRRARSNPSQDMRNSKRLIQAQQQAQQAPTASPENPQPYPQVSYNPYNNTNINNPPYTSNPPTNTYANNNYSPSSNLPKDVYTTTFAPPPPLLSNNLRRADSFPKPSQPNTTPRPPCRGCLQPITGPSLRDRSGRLSGRYHRACFTCVDCSAPFPSGEFYVLNDTPLCKRDYHLRNGSCCVRCSDGIEGQYVDTDGRSKWHTECFSCVRCDEVLGQEYWEVDGRQMCRRHAFERVNGNGAYGVNGGNGGGDGTGRPMKRRTRLGMMGMGGGGGYGGFSGGYGGR
ncbi:hypothetical protein BT63DRAFT_315218 [Microthyrium microscopicum]|uniref:LIM zinc-binding domain-containing protein n=1 Tax=Microthyrium microscopicum TaxID=703497 RepID=A0A6A6U2Z9_9PEZI|nr:hypothetical protein BT63DRAFT_315218 [Microthyrium microscopicum]